MIRKYQNELMLLTALIVLLGGFLYQKGMAHRLDVSLERSKTAARQITETKTLQKVWSTKGLKNKVAALRGVVASEKVKTFDQKKNRLNAHFARLSGQELNMVATQLARLPVQIQELGITRSGTLYEVRCSCTW